MKIYINKLNESWIIDRIRDDWYKYNDEISVQKPQKADIFWLLSPWVWKKIPKRHLKNKFTICTIHHIDFEKFDNKEKSDFYKLDQYVDIYHVISKNTQKQLEQLTSKKSICLPFWIEPKQWFHIENKKKLRLEYNFSSHEYLIGSFQRDTESSDLKSPKLIKGPDIFLDLVTKIYSKNNNMKIVLTGKRRDYLIENFEKLKIPYRYFEMVSLEELNKLYNLLDLYIVSSRVEGGPQAILECAITKTPILSTDVGVASEILSPESIYTPSEFFYAKTNVEYAFENSQKFLAPNYMQKFVSLFQHEFDNYNK